MAEQNYERALDILRSRLRKARPPPRSCAGKTGGTRTQQGLPGLAGMPEWLQMLNLSPDKLAQTKIIHVAGTKGKGSTCAFIETILRAHGRRTGFPRKTALYTSPHLMAPEERIRINMQPLSQTLFAKYFFEIHDLLPALAREFDESRPLMERGPRYLQLFALMAFHVAVREKVDVLILETHCGGEHDATNVITSPVVTAITKLGMDHVDMLGDTIEKIAWHKSGIFKHGAAALSAQQEDAARKVLETRAAEKGEDVKFVEIDGRLPASADQLTVDVQRQNASLAIAACDAFLERLFPGGDRISTEDVSNGLRLFSWPGRFQIIRDGDVHWYLDAAHNDMSVQIAARWFADNAGKNGAAASDKDSRRVLVFSHINELRDSVALLETLANSLVEHHAMISHVVFTTYNESDTVKSFWQSQGSTTLQDAWKRIHPGSSVFHEPTIESALKRAKQIGNKILITGSQHLVGPSLRLLKWNPNIDESD